MSAAAGLLNMNVVVSAAPKVSLVGGLRDIRYQSPLLNKTVFSVSLFSLTRSYLYYAIVTILILSIIESKLTLSGANASFR